MNSRLERVLVAAWVVAGFATGGCDRDAATTGAGSGGDVERGRAAINRYGCNACHAIPGVPGPGGVVGPSLAGIASRTQLRGGLQNRPDNMLRWLQDPQAVDPKTTMPKLHVTDDDARDIAAYLYTMR
jgi:cytochrome c2